MKVKWLELTGWTKTDKFCTRCGTLVYKKYSHTNREFDRKTGKLIEENHIYSKRRLECFYFSGPRG